jgi:stage II sporulation protein AA (anti-sigma F factor antagonist)
VTTLFGHRHEGDPRPSSTFTVSVDGWDVVRLHGELDLATVATFDAAFDLLGPVQQVVVLDLADVRFVDSVGLTRLVALHRRLVADGGRLVFRHLQPNVRRVFAVTELDTFFQVEE